MQRQTVFFRDLLELVPHGFIPDLVETADLLRLPVGGKAALQIPPFVVGLALLQLLRGHLVGMAAFIGQPLGGGPVFGGAVDAAEREVVPVVDRLELVQGLFRVFGEPGALPGGGRVPDQPLLQPEKPGGVGGDGEQSQDHRRDQRRPDQLAAGKGGGLCHSPGQNFIHGENVGRVDLAEDVKKLIFVHCSPSCSR